MFSGYYLFGKIKKYTGYPKNNNRGFNIYVLQIFATIDTIVPVLVYGIFMN